MTDAEFWVEATIIFIGAVVVTHQLLIIHYSQMKGEWDLWQSHGNQPTAR